MSFLSIIPEELLSKKAKYNFLQWLYGAPFPHTKKKYILIDWCKTVKEPLTKELFDFIG